MDARPPIELGLRWRAPVAVTAVSIAVMLVLILYSPDIGFLGILLVGPLAVLILIGLILRARAKAKLVRLWLLFLCVLLSWQMFEHMAAIRSEGRWLAASGYWKEEALKEPAMNDSGIKCLIWDGWGGMGASTDVYLVFSRDDGLRNYSPSSLNGLPQPVWKVERLEKQWYSVTFYTNEGWDGCGIWRQ
jgi:hypothetical protein